MGDWGRQFSNFKRSHQLLFLLDFESRFHWILQISSRMYLFAKFQMRGELRRRVGGVHRWDGGSGDPPDRHAPRLRHHRPHRRRPEQAQRQGPRRLSLHQAAGDLRVTLGVLILDPNGPPTFIKSYK